MKGTSGKRIAVVGGGLAGLAAAVALAERGGAVTLFEAKQKLGGRAGSFVDPESGETVDQCQHVTMGCCTNFADFCRRTSIAHLLTRHDVLHFFGPDGRRSDFRPIRWLPPPLHLGPAFRRLSYLRRRDQWCIARGMLRLMRMPPTAEMTEPTIGQWLKQTGQTENAINYYWKVILESALGDTLDRVSLSAARKVFIDGFLSHRDACAVYTPTVTLTELYDRQVRNWLTAKGVEIRCGASIQNLQTGSQEVQVSLTNGERLEFDCGILALPPDRISPLLPAEIYRQLPAISALLAIVRMAPIMAIHLWFNRPITDLPHAVLVGKLSQWVFARSALQEQKQAPEFYYQVVISGCHDLLTRPRTETLQQVLAELGEVFPATKSANLLRSRLVCDRDAVFSAQPGLDSLRPSQITPIPNLFLAGDWTATGWPATMEGAVRSGYLAAEGVLRRWGSPERVLQPDLPRQGLARWLVR